MAASLRSTRPGARAVASGVALVALMAAGAARAEEEEPPAAAAPELAEMSLEQLANIEVTTASRKPESQMVSPNAVFVITAEEIRRSGVTSVPEALRLVPGVEVAHATSNQWAVGIRGFGSILSRGLLVLIDGRSVYQPLFAGVYWEIQDYLLEDIERIEVILGPGGTLWGANAVNGVINIITRHASQTLGAAAGLLGGNYEQGTAKFRWGGRIGENFNYRVWGKLAHRAPFNHPDGNDFDRWGIGAAGLRADWDIRPSDHLFVSAGFYRGIVGLSSNVVTLDPPATMRQTGQGDLFGGHVLGRWQHTFRGGSVAQVQMYYDRFERNELIFREDRDTFDIDVQHRVKLPWRQELVYGVGYRVSSGLAQQAVETVGILPPRRTDHVYSAFAQDELSVVPDKFRIVIGLKAEHNDYTGFEFQPSGRLLVTPKPWMAIWAAVSRAVRRPTRVEHDIRLDALLDPSVPLLARLQGNPEFASEQLLAVEAGYRVQPIKQLFLALAGFYNRYDGLLGFTRGTPFMEGTPSVTFVPFNIVNAYDAHVAGLNVRYDLSLFSWLRLRGAYSYLHLDMVRRNDMVDPSTEVSTEGTSPEHQIYIWPSLNLPWRIELDAIVRYVSPLVAQQVDGYVNLDVRVAWRPIQRLELSVVGQNITSNHREEFAGGRPTSGQVPRSVYGKVSWGF